MKSGLLQLTIRDLHGNDWVVEVEPITRASESGQLPDQDDTQCDQLRFVARAGDADPIDQLPLRHQLICLSQGVPQHFEKPKTSPGLQVVHAHLES